MTLSTMALRPAALSAAYFFVAIFALRPAELPRIKIESGTGLLIVNGQPFLILGGELGNSSAGTAAEADQIVSKMAAMHVNTILMPVAWEQIEPKEGTYDFSIWTTGSKPREGTICIWCFYGLVAGKTRSRTTRRPG